MKLKHLRAKLKRKFKPRGLIISSPRVSKTTPGQVVVDVTIAKWYFPWFLVKHLKQAGIAPYFWPYLLWKAYTGKMKSHAIAHNN